MSNSDGNLLSFIAGAAVGALVGVGVGILMAPDKGEKTRELISNKSHDLKHDLESQVEKSKDKLETFAHSLADKIKSGLENGKLEVSSGSKKNEGKA